jgi:hypothetical protein
MKRRIVCPKCQCFYDVSEKTAESIEYFSCLKCGETFIPCSHLWQGFTNEWQKNLDNMRKLKAVRIDLEKNKNYYDCIPYACAIVFCKCLNIHHCITPYDIDYLVSDIEKDIDIEYKKAITRNLKRLCILEAYDSLKKVILKQYKKDKSPNGYIVVFNESKKIIDKAILERDKKTYRFSCPYCGQHYEGMYEHIGLKINCNYCRKKIKLVV